MDLRTLIVFVTFLTLVAMSKMPASDSSEPVNYHHTGIHFVFNPSCFYYNVFSCTVSTTPSINSSRSIGTSSTLESVQDENEEEDDEDFADDGDEETDGVDMSDYDETNNRTMNEDEDEDDTETSESEVSKLRWAG